MNVRYRILMLFAIASLFVKTQTLTPLSFQKKDNFLSIGYGGVNVWVSLSKGNMQSSSQQFQARFPGSGSSFSYSTTNTGTFFLKYEHAVGPRVGLGFSAGYFKASVTEKYNYPRTFGNQAQNYYQSVSIANNSASVGARLVIHTGPGPKLDPYLALCVGYTSSRITETFTSNDPWVADEEPLVYTTAIPLYLGGTVGARVLLAESVFFNGEVGLDKWTVFQGGFALKM